MRVCATEACLKCRDVKQLELRERAHIDLLSIKPNKNGVLFVSCVFKHDFLFFLFFLNVDIMGRKI